MAADVSDLQSCYMTCARDKNEKIDRYIMILMRANPVTWATPSYGLSNGFAPIEGVGGGGG
jgi:hypothetical protein